MYYDACTYRRGNRTYRRELLRESFRVGGKVRKRTVANITNWPEGLKRVIREAVGGGAGSSSGPTVSSLLERSGRGVMQQGKSVGAVATVLAAAERLGIADAVGRDRQGKLALFQVVARVVDHGSRLSAVRMARTHAAAEMIGLGGFDEDDLYENLSWLCPRQQEIEDRLFAKRYADGRSPAMFLYDVTSSYFEGEHNALGAFGYNRDGKKGKRQMVLGLLTDDSGDPLSIEVFPGNTTDTTTVAEQVDKLRSRFRGKELTLVGDRGMLKGPQQEQLGAIGMRYLTAITKAQIGTLLNSGTIQMELFDKPIAEVSDPGESVRYILRRNPVQAERVAARRNDQFASWLAALERAEKYLETHPRAAAETQVRALRERARGLKLSGWLQVEARGRTLHVEVDEEARAEAGKLDGCYVLKTDLPAAVADASTVDGRYHDLSKVEWAFRTSKTVHLEIRPVHLRKEDRTRAHALVVMLAYMIIRHLAAVWHDLDITVEEAISDLAQLTWIDTAMPDGSVLHELPEPRPDLQALLGAASVKVAELSYVPPPCVDTKVKLTSSRN